MTLPRGIKQLRPITSTMLLIIARMADAGPKQVEETVVVKLAEVEIAKVPEEVVAESVRSF